MPHIKSIRLVNVQYNNETQMYDDFYMDFNGEDSVFSLRNGGGKTILFQMILQTVLPKAYLSKEKPLALIFEGKNGNNRTSHVVVEWMLEDDSPYPYLITGFSARKKANDTYNNGEDDEGSQLISNRDIDHRNWTILTKGGKEADIRKLPLYEINDAGAMVIATFDDVRKNIINPQKNRGDMVAQMFDSIERYHEYLLRYQLLPAELRLIKDVNSGEGGFKDYFRQNATSRKLIENLYLKIIDEIEALRSGKKLDEATAVLPDALIGIQEKLADLQEKQKNLHEFEATKLIYEEFVEKNKNLSTEICRFEDQLNDAICLKNGFFQEVERLTQELTNNNTLRNEKNQECRANQLNQLLHEAGLIQHKISKLEVEKKRKTSEKERCGNDLKKIRDDINWQLTLESYNEYRDLINEADKATQTLKRIELSENEVEAEYRRISGELAYLLTLEKESLSDEKKETCAGLTDINDQLEENRTEKDRESLGIKKGTCNGYEGAIEKLNPIVDELNRSIQGSGSIEYFVEQDKYLNSQIRLISDGEEALNEYQKEGKNLNEAINKLEIDNIRHQAELKNDLEKQNAMQVWIGEYERSRDAINKQIASYQRLDIADYASFLNKTINANNTEIRQLETVLQDKTLIKQSLEDNGYYMPNQKIIELFENINKNNVFTYCKLGMEWIYELESATEKEQLLKQYPMLIYSIIVDDVGFNKLMIHPDLIKMPMGTNNQLIPIVNIDNLQAMDNLNHEAVFYFCDTSAVFLNIDDYNRHLKDLAIQIEVIESKLENKRESLREWQEKEHEVRKYQDLFSPEVVVERMRIQTEQGEHINCLENKLKTTQKTIADTQTALADNESRIQKKRVLIEVAREILGICKNHQARDAELSLLIRDNEAIKKEIKELQDFIETKISASRKLENEKKSEMERLRKINDDLNEVNRQLNDLQAVEKIESQETLNKIKTIYGALKNRLSGSHNEVNQIKQNITKYQKQADTKAGHIKREYGHDLEELFCREESGEVFSIPNTDMIDAKRKAERLCETNYRLFEEEVVSIEKAIEGKYGEIKHFIEKIPEEQRHLLPVYNDVYDYETEIVRIKNNGELLRRQIEEIENRCSGIRNKINQNQNDLKNFERFIKERNLSDGKDVATTLNDYECFKDQFDQIEDQMQELKKDWQKRIEKIERKELSRFYNKKPIIQLIEIRIPDTTVKCEQFEQDLQLSLEIMSVQMDKIEKDIEALIQYQEDFIDKCLQRARINLDHLKRINSLSKITVAGESIQMVKIKIHDHKDSIKRMRMEEYIKDIVSQMQRETVERHKIKEHLSSKRLLAQVIDMDRTKIAMYKIEEIAENSKHKDWEKIVGSDGQDNALYFMFAVSIIAFIRNISTGWKAKRVKKLIIVDNPFGKTSSLYLWNPMFEMLKQNNVQLITFGHDIPAEILQRFNSIYNLTTEKYTNHKRCVRVLKDCHVEKDDSFLGSGEQLSILF